MRNPEQQSQSRKGFMLLEVVVALAIISISLAIILGSLSLIVKSDRTMSNYAKATALLDKKMFELKNAPLVEYSLKGKFDDPFQSFQWRADQKNTSHADTRKITLVVSWPEGRGSKEISATTCVYEKKTEPK